MNPRIRNCGSQSQPLGSFSREGGLRTERGFCHPSGEPCCCQRWMLTLKHSSYEVFLAVGKHITDPYTAVDTRQLLTSCMRVAGCLRAMERCRRSEAAPPTPAHVKPHSHSDVLHPHLCSRGFTTSIHVTKAALGSCALNLQAWSQPGPLCWRLVLLHLASCL